ncbi:MAG: hypothetical protein ACJ74W_13450 [Pyrinomonadaceae bacterium]
MLEAKNISVSIDEPSHTDVSTVQELAPPSDWRELGEAEHFVQFYETDTFLLDSLHAAPTLAADAHSTTPLNHHQITT